MTAGDLGASFVVASTHLFMLVSGGTGATERVRDEPSVSHSPLSKSQVASLAKKKPKTVELRWILMEGSVVVSISFVMLSSLQICCTYHLLHIYVYIYTNHNEIISTADPKYTLNMSIK